MAWRPDIRACPLQVPPVEEDSGALQCSKCRQVLYDASSVTEAESRSLASLGRCGRWLLDRSGSQLLPSPRRAPRPHAPQRSVPSSMSGSSRRMGIPWTSR